MMTHATLRDEHGPCSSDSSVSRSVQSTRAALKERARPSVRSVRRPMQLSSFYFLLLCTLTNHCSQSGAKCCFSQTHSLPQTLKTFHKFLLEDHKTLLSIHSSILLLKSQIPNSRLSTDDNSKTQIFTSETSIEQGREKTKRYLIY